MKVGLGALCCVNYTNRAIRSEHRGDTGALGYRERDGWMDAGVNEQEAGVLTQADILALLPTPTSLPR